MADEIDYLLKAEFDGVVTYSGKAAKLIQIAEWLDTPKGQIWGSPSWGHELIQYRHAPMGDNTAASMENSIAAKLPQDISNMTLSSVKVEAGDEIDQWWITIGIEGVDETLKAPVKL